MSQARDRDQATYGDIGTRKRRLLAFFGVHLGVIQVVGFQVSFNIGMISFDDGTYAHLRLVSWAASQHGHAEVGDAFPW